MKLIVFPSSFLRVNLHTVSFVIVIEMPQSLATNCRGADLPTEVSQ